MRSISSGALSAYLWTARRISEGYCKRSNRTGALGESIWQKSLNQKLMNEIVPLRFGVRSSNPSKQSSPVMNLDPSLLANREAWRGAPLSARLTAIEGIFISHKAVRALFDYIEHQFQFNEARGSADGVLVIAESGTGKTRTIKQLELMYPSVITPTLTTRPVVRLNIPPSPTPKSLGKAMLDALGDGDPSSGNAYEKFERIEALLVSVATKVIAIDNFQDIPARRRVRGIAEMSDWFRNLCSIRFPGVVVAFGTKEAAIVRDSNPQLCRRMQARFELPMFSITGDENIKRWRHILKELDKRMPLAEDSKLSDSAMSVRIFVATGGNFDYLKKLLAQSMTVALKRGSERIDMQDLQFGFAGQHQLLAEGGNPFHPDFASTKLNGPGQIFHDSSTGGDTFQAYGPAVSAPTAQKSNSPRLK